MAKKKTEIAVVDDDTYSEERFRIAQEIIDVINARLPSGATRLAPITLAPKLKRADAQYITDELHLAYQLRGGISGLLAHSIDHPKEFYAMWAKSAGSGFDKATLSPTFNIQTAVPGSPLDSKVVSVTWDQPISDIDFDVDGEDD